MGSGPFGLGAFQFDGVALLIRYLSMVPAVLGGILLFGGRKLLVSTERAERTKFDTILGYSLNSVGWVLLILASSMLVLCYVQFYYSPHSAQQIEQVRKCLKETDIGVSCFLYELL